MVTAARAKNSMLEDRQQERLDNSNHQKTLQRLNNNPGLSQRLNQLQNLDNSLGLITDVDKVTPQQFQEFQQAVRSNLGIKGTSGVDERSGTYLTSLGLRADNFNQFLSADPQDIGKNNALLKHVTQLASIERRNAQSQYEKRLSAVTAGNESMYARRPDLKNDLDSAVGAWKGQLDSPNTGQAPGASQGGQSSGGSPSQSPQASDPVQIQKASRFKQLYDKMTDPASKKIAIERAKNMFGPDILSKVGIQ